jgi:N-dimethylarginine dimethylaminohydrolase
MTRAPGNKRPERWATFGGRGWRGRKGDHAHDVVAGIWRRCGMQSEVDPLREVVLSWPGDEIGRIRDPNAANMVAPVNLTRLRQQSAALVAFYEAHGVTVHMSRRASVPANYLFMRDVFFATPFGAVIGRMGAAVRAGEEPHAAAALAALGVPLLAFIRGPGTFEGADALWLARDVVLVGVGRRTNKQGAQQLSAVLASVGVTVIRVPVPRGVQHLLGIVNFLDRDLVVVREGAPAVLVTELRARGYQIVWAPAIPEVRYGGTANFVALGRRRIVMPAGGREMRRRYEACGVECHEVDVTEYLNAAGGVACATGVLVRSAGR